MTHLSEYERRQTREALAREPKVSLSRLIDRALEARLRRADAEYERAMVARALRQVGK